MFDLVIKDAEIYDGAGNAPVRGDLGVTNGKIHRDLRQLGAAKETVKADGLALIPALSTAIRITMRRLPGIPSSIPRRRSASPRR